MDTTQHQGYAWLVLHIQLVHILKKKYYTNNGAPTFTQESFTLRKWFLVEMLKYRGNESTENIPKVLQETLRWLRDTYCEKYYQTSKKIGVLCATRAIHVILSKKIIIIVIDFSRPGYPAHNRPRCTTDTSALLK